MLKRNYNKKAEVADSGPLAVGYRRTDIFLLQRRVSRGIPTLLLYASKDGVTFSGRPKKVILKHKDKSIDDASLCSGFHLASSDEELILTYVYQSKRARTLRYATSLDEKKWLVARVFKDIHVPAAAARGAVSAMYFGTERLHVALSKNLRTWMIKEPPRVPQFHFSQGLPVRVISALSTDDGIAVFYEITIAHDILTDVNLQNKKVGEGRSLKLGAALFSNDDPARLLWQSQAPLAELPLEEGVHASFAGIVPLSLQGKAVLRLYVAHKSGEVGFMELSPDVLSDHRERRGATLRKFAGNPILRPTIHRWESGGVFNPTAVYVGGRVHLLYRAVGGDGLSYIGYASSRDGVTIDERLHSPVYSLHLSFEKHIDGTPHAFPPSIFGSGGSWGGGCEDPKATLIGDRIYMTYVAHAGHWPMRTALTSISVADFLAKRWRWARPMLMSPPGVGSKSVVILPEKVGGQYVVFHRIWPDIIVDFVPDLTFGEGVRWLGNKGAIAPRYSFWDSQKMSMGAAPIKTAEGWLAIYSAVDRMDSSRYKIGAMLLSQDDPSKVIARTRQAILSPEAWYENDGKPGIAYPGGAVEKDAVIYVYYGGADKVSCVATIPTEELLGHLLKDREPSYNVRKVSV